MTRLPPGDGRVGTMLRLFPFRRVPGARAGHLPSGFHRTVPRAFRPASRPGFPPAFRPVPVRSPSGPRPEPRAGSGRKARPGSARIPPLPRPGVPPPPTGPTGGLPRGCRRRVRGTPGTPSGCVPPGGPGPRAALSFRPPGTATIGPESAPAKEGRPVRRGARAGGGGGRGTPAAGGPGPGRPRTSAFPVLPGRPRRSRAIRARSPLRQPGPRDNVRLSRWPAGTGNARNAY